MTSQRKIEFWLNVTVAFLLVVIVALMLALSRAWRNERYLDRVLNSYTTTIKDK